MGAVPIPAFTVDHREAEAMIESGKTMVARRDLHGSQGRGATLHKINPLPSCPLYTEFLNKVAEGRIHVFRGKVIDAVEKVRKSGTEPSLCWNHAKGYTFTHRLRHSVTDANDIAIKAVGILGLDFGAVDVILYNDKWYILEVNTAPGLSIQRSFDAYVKAIQEAAC